MGYGHRFFEGVRGEVRSLMMDVVAVGGGVAAACGGDRSRAFRW